MTLLKIISGGQTGVDVAALRAARAMGLQTGGWMPHGWRTLDGRHPEYAHLYGLQEHRESSYPPRTSANVAAAGATLRLAVDFDSAGERCTREKIARHRKPHMDVPFSYGDAVDNGTPASVVAAERHRRTLATSHPYDDEVARVARWLSAGGWPVLNVAGNSERTAPGIERYAQAFLEDVFRARTKLVVRLAGDRPVF